MPTLSTSGSPTLNGDSTCTINSTGSDRVYTTSVSLGSYTQMWVAMRCTPSWDTSAAVEHTFFRYAFDTNNELFVQYGAAAGSLAVGRDGSGGVGGQIASGPVWAVGDNITLIAYWTASEIGFSYNGGNFETATNSRNTFTAATAIDFGQRGYSATGFVDAKYHWAAMGTGTITTADAAALHANGNSDPSFATLPGSPSFLWKCVDFTYEDSAAPASGTRRMTLLGVG